MMTQKELDSKQTNWKLFRLASLVSSSILLCEEDRKQYLEMVQRARVRIQADYNKKYPKTL